ncbi:MAG: prepilin-type N-terminal cleavage/methylation domain-containing protein [Campylobacterota bacterium]|nr:prepilin-type N-terminal cleavage/methylation domain-containing protein [Campylobacterota bacterium]
MNNFKYAFSLIELIFVIVIIGILSVVVTTQYGGIINEAKFSQAKATISSVRAAIIMHRRGNIIKGDPSYPAILDDASYNSEQESLFDGNGTIEMLQYPIYSKIKAGKWMKIAENQYHYRVSDSSAKDLVFDYNSSTGKFDCDHSDSDCQKLTQ